METIYKIRRKSDGKFFECRNQWSDNSKAKIFSSIEKLISYVKSSGEFQDYFNEVEVVCFTVKPKAVTSFDEWFDVNSFFLEQKKKDLQPKGRFLYAVMKANLRKESIDSSLILSNEEGWFLISEMSQKFRMPPQLILDIVKYFKVHYFDTLKQAFWVNQDQTKICFSSVCDEALGIKQEYNVTETERELEKFMNYDLKDHNRVKQLTMA